MAGDAPCGARSTVTSAPGGSVRTSRPPVVVTLFGSSMYCEICAPAATEICIRRGSPAPRSTTAWTPAGSVSVNGVTPDDVPSMSTRAPDGLDCMTSVPVPGASVLAEARRRTANNAPAVMAAMTAAATATRGHCAARAAAGTRLGAGTAGAGAGSGGGDVTRAGGRTGSTTSTCTGAIGTTSGINTAAAGAITSGGAVLCSTVSAGAACTTCATGATP